jgi:hypothetical protein
VKHSRFVIDRYAICAQCARPVHPGDAVRNVPTTTRVRHIDCAAARGEVDKLRRLLAEVLQGFSPDPGTSDLYDEQPIHVRATLGWYRRAQREVLGV